MKKPLLSIGIIFKNEIRCLERCLKSLQPLRDALPCEVVMADTGANDGSRDVAERYADILIDFPWINDFSAARNAVMDRCSGKWYMSIDCDEWVDENIEGFVTFLTTDETFDFASVIIRNYSTLKLDKSGSYSDFLGVRLLRMSTGMRYEGAVHERWSCTGDLRTMMIREAVFHHDGYVYQDKAKQVEKQERNMALLRDKLKEDPENLILLNQCVESSVDMPEEEGYLRRALTGVKEKRTEWKLFGPVIYSHAIRFAMKKKLPELEQWISEAEESFAESIFFRVQISFLVFAHYWEKDDFSQAVCWGERYLQGVEDYYQGNFDRAELLASTLSKTDTYSRLSLATVLAAGYLHEDQPEQCIQLLDRLDPAEMDGKQIGDCVKNLGRMYSEFGWDTDASMLRLWARLGEPIPDKEQAERRRTAFLQAGSLVFRREHREGEVAGRNHHRHAYTAFLPLEGSCPLGDAAAILETDAPNVLEKKLACVEHWDEIPIQVLTHSLEHGVSFPLPNRPLNVEEMDRLVSRLSVDKERFLPLVLHLTEDCDWQDWQGLLWRRGLVISAVWNYPWSSEEQEEAQGMAIARAFARVEREFLPRCYNPELLQEEGLFVLPPLHRFGWYCARAFDVLEQGDPVEYVRLLRAGLDVCEEVKDMVEFLADHTPELQTQTPEPSAELRVLADQIRTILENFSPGDPAVTALKQSEAYQKVAYLIEGMEVPIMGGLIQ